MRRTIDFQITTEIIRKILQGLKYSFITSTEHEEFEIILHPPQEGIFFTIAELKQIERIVAGSAGQYTFENLMREKWKNKT